MARAVAVASAPPSPPAAGDSVWVFYRFDSVVEHRAAPFPPHDGGCAAIPPRIGWTHSWQPAVVASVDGGVVTADVAADGWVTRPGVCQTHGSTVRARFSAADVRARRTDSAPLPRVSLVVVRWGGDRAVPDAGADDGAGGGWGRLGPNVGDRYIAALLQALYRAAGPTFAVLTAFVANSADLRRLYPQALAGLLRSPQAAAMYFLWPAAWLDGPSTSPGYVSADALFGTMRAFEAAGVATRHPHPSHLYQLLVSKSWMGTMCMSPRFAVPATTRVPRCEAEADAVRAATSALRALTTLRRARGDAVTEEWDQQKVVAKLGYSWEAMDVYPCAGVRPLADRLREFCTQQGSTSDSVYVQEFVESDVECRAYVVAGRIEQFLYTRFGKAEASGSPTGFECALSRQDAAEERMAELVSEWCTWMLAESCTPASSVRIDFFIRRTGSGVAVATGEVTEQGGNTLTWTEGPHLVFKAIAADVLKPRVPGVDAGSPRRQQLQGQRGREAAAEEPAAKRERKS
eukprot:TRINITY_DN26111_c0_g1_i2.p1 TRINITY_DN26111_c0_g1~~TRINITY_DN26111_c0_g1_i2.p1  ORF type:complete len:517 (+),score=143.30 TRINITY_DN26111_c0_g1_i2:70-1620(+)